jgi:hypothetical protein
MIGKKYDLRSVGPDPIEFFSSLFSLRWNFARHERGEGTPTSYRIFLGSLFSLSALEFGTAPMRGEGTPEAGNILPSLIWKETGLLGHQYQPRVPSLSSVCPQDSKRSFPLKRTLEKKQLLPLYIGRVTHTEL